MSERALQSLLHMIHSRRLLPGTLLEERKLAEQLGISRTPLRAALNVLEGRGLLTRLPNRGMQVIELGIEEYLEVMSLRRLLEAEAAALTARWPPVAELGKLKQRVSRCLARENPSVDEHLAVDFEIHSLIAAASRNRRLALIVDDLHRRARLCRVERVPARVLDSGKEHLVLLDALLAGDSNASREAMATHIENVRQNFLMQLSQF